MENNVVLICTTNVLTEVEFQDLNGAVVLKERGQTGRFTVSIAK